jgi:hypothetical protein
MPEDFFYGWGGRLGFFFWFCTSSRLLSGLPNFYGFGTCLLGAGRGCFGSSKAVCGPGAAVKGACGLGTTLSALICSWTCCSVLVILVGGGVALPEISSDFWVDAELYKSITSYKGGAIDQLCHTYASF